MIDLGFFIIPAVFSEHVFWNMLGIAYTLGGWLVLLHLLLYAGLYMTAWYKTVRYTSTWNHVLLAVDVPLENLQTPKAVEQLFTHIFSVMEPPSIGFVYRRGFQQFSFSFEIVSIGGYIQFLVRTLDKYRDVVEAAVYAQYPEAEITEVEDYVTDFPDRYPNDTHNIWAADYVLTNHWAFPLRVYQEFEHSISKDTVLKDPVGTILESFSRIGPGEQMWMQTIVEPIAESRWKKEAIAKVKEMIGAKKKKKELPFASNVKHETKFSWDEISAQIFGTPRSEVKSDKGRDEPPNQILYLTPGEKALVEQMEDKLRKLGFRTKIRLVYIARNEVYNPSRGVNSFTGAMNQFTVPSSNALLPKYLTSTQYFFAEERKNFRRNVLMRAYKNRDIEAGRSPYILGIEELATIWHFPMSHVKTPLLQKTLGRRGEPPSGLPVEGIPVGEDVEPAEEKKTPAPKQVYRTDAGDVVESENGVRFG